MKAIVCGNELVTDEVDVHAALDQVRLFYGFLVVVETGKRGVEMFATSYARKHGLGHERYTPPSRPAEGTSPFVEYVRRVEPEVIVVVGGHDARAKRIGEAGMDKQLVVAFASLSNDPKPSPPPDGRSRPRQVVP